MCVHLADESSYYNSSFSHGVTNVSHLTAVPEMPALPQQIALSPQGGTETQIGKYESIYILIFMAVVVMSQKEHLAMLHNLASSLPRSVFLWSAFGVWPSSSKVVVRPFRGRKHHENFF